MAVNMKPASADTVRAWAAEQGWTDEFGRAPKDRGRLPTSLISEFDQAHKRNRIKYTAGYRDDTSAEPQSRNTGSNSGRSNAGKEVATRSSSRSSGSTPARKDTTPAKATAPAAKQESPEPIRVQARQVSDDVEAGLPVQSINVEDAIALLQSAAASRKKGDAPPALIAVYTLI